MQRVATGNPCHLSRYTRVKPLIRQPGGNAPNVQTRHLLFSDPVPRAQQELDLAAVPVGRGREPKAQPQPVGQPVGEVGKQADVFLAQPFPGVERQDDLLLADEGADLGGEVQHQPSNARIDRCCEADREPLINDGLQVP